MQNIKSIGDDNKTTIIGGLGYYNDTNNFIIY